MTYTLALLSGLMLGTLGGGGSILIVPILIYLAKIEPKLAIALSLAIVFFASSTAVLANLKSKTINFKIALFFIPFSLTGTLLGAYLSKYLSSTIQLLIFAAIMLAVAITMLKKSKETTSAHFSILSFGIKASFVGLLTGVIGVGGGFLIVPTLNLIAKQSIKVSISTSLLIIALNSLGGFLQYVNVLNIPWEFLIPFTLLTSLGSLVGSIISKKSKPESLKKYFSYFLFLMSFFIIIKELLLA